MILYAGILSLIIALVRGGSIRRLGDLEIRQIWLVFIPPAFIIAFILARKFGLEDVVRATSGWLHLLAYCMLLTLVWLNRRIAGVTLLGVGLILNFTVMAANGGKMPVSYEAAQRAGASQEMLQVLQGDDMDRHLLMSEHTRLNFLADIIPVPILKSVDPEVASVGDIFLALGVFVLIQAAMLPAKRRKTSADDGET